MKTPDFKKFANSMLGYSKEEVLAKMWELLVVPLIQNMESQQQTNQSLVKKLNELEANTKNHTRQYLEKAKKIVMFSSNSNPAEEIQSLIDELDKQ